MILHAPIAQSRLKHSVLQRTAFAYLLFSISFPQITHFISYTLSASTPIQSKSNMLASRTESQPTLLANAQSFSTPSRVFIKISSNFLYIFSCTLSFVETVKTAYKPPLI
jgi:hypothetical protein